MVKVTQVNKLDDIFYLKEDWNRLLEKSETNVIFLTFEWITNWWRHFGGDKKLLVLLIKSDERLIGIAPLMISTSRILGLQIKKIEFIGTPLSDYSDFIISEKKQEVLKEIFAYLSEIPGWDLINLREIPELSPTLSITNKFPSNFPLSFYTTLSTYCPTVILHNGPESERSIKKKLKKYSIMRHVNFFKKNGKLSFLHYTDTTQIDTLLNPFFEQHIKRWQVTSTPSKFNVKKYRDFYRELAGSLSKTGWFGFCVLNYNERPVAFHYGFTYDDKYTWYTPSYDPIYSKRSPGKVILKFLIEYAIDNNFKEVDLTRGDESYKFWWSNKTRKNFHANFCKKSIFSRSLYLYFIFRFCDILKLQVKKHKFIRHMLINLTHFTSFSYYLQYTRVARGYISEYGHGRLLLHTVKNIYSFVFDYDRLIIFENDFSEELNIVSPALKVDIRNISLNNLDEFEKQDIFIRRKKFFLERFQRGDECFGAFYKDKLIHTSWVTFKDTHIFEIDQILNLKDKEACIYASETNFKYRGKRIYPAVLTYILSSFKSENINKVYIYSRSRNLASINGIRRANFKQSKAFGYLRVLGKLR